MQQMHLKFGNGTQDSDSVYLMKIDKAVYDISDPSYMQTHCLRFELDRTPAKGRAAGGLKVTDVDFWLQGNRHAVADAHAFLKDA